MCSRRSTLNGARLLTTDPRDLTAPTPLLLDTRIWIWHVEGIAAELPATGRTAVKEAAHDGRALVSAISVWEITMLEQRGVVTLSTDVHAWVAASRVAPGIRIVPLSLAVLIDGPRLPLWTKRSTTTVHKDPADRWIVATARQRSAILITRDDEIRHYAEQGHVRAFDARP
jgi:PIN domain nuclease of toxin-antitoxin system